MAYMIFICTVYVGRADLNVCNNYDNSQTFSSITECQRELQRRESINSGVTGSGVLRGGGEAVVWHRTVVCK